MSENMCQRPFDQQHRVHDDDDDDDDDNDDDDNGDERFILKHVLSFTFLYSYYLNLFIDAMLCPPTTSVAYHSAFAFADIIFFSFSVHDYFSIYYVFDNECIHNKQTFT